MYVVQKQYYFKLKVFYLQNKITHKNCGNASAGIEGKVKCCFKNSDIEKGATMKIKDFSINQFWR